MIIALRTIPSYLITYSLEATIDWIEAAVDTSGRLEREVGLDV